MTQPNVEELKQLAHDTLARFLVPAPADDLSDELRPDPDDYEAVFAPEAVARARGGYQAFWLQSPRPAPRPGQTEIRLFAAPASMLTDDNDLSRRFPGGYRRIAHLLNPHRIWMAWKFLAPGASTGLAYDGLVWLDGRFAWFPKPWRVIAD